MYLSFESIPRHTEHECKAHAHRDTDGQCWTTRCTELVCVSGFQHTGKSGWLFCWWGDTRGLWGREAEVEDGKGAQNSYAFQPLRTSVSLAAWRFPGPWSLVFLWGLFCKGLVAGRLGRDTQQGLCVESLPFLSMAFLLTRNKEGHVAFWEAGWSESQSRNQQQKSKYESS